MLSKVAVNRIIQRFASYNKTDPSRKMTMGDSALGFIGQLLCGVVKSSTPAAKSTAAVPAASAAPGAACANGSCAVKQGPVCQGGIVAISD
jgi:hypothetical protein